MALTVCILMPFLCCTTAAFLFREDEPSCTHWDQKVTCWSLNSATPSLTQLLENSQPQGHTPPLQEIRHTITSLDIGGKKITIPNDALRNFTSLTTLRLEGLTGWLITFTHHATIESNALTYTRNLKVLKFIDIKPPANFDQVLQPVKSSLKMFWVRDVDMRDRMHTFAPLTNLVAFEIIGCDLKEFKPEWLRNSASTLTYLHLNFNKIKELKADNFDGLINLHLISLLSNRISTIDPNAFRGLPNLREIWLNGNKLTTVSPEWFRSATNLQLLYLDGNPLRGVNRSTFSVLQQHPTVYLPGDSYVMRKINYEDIV